MLKNFMAKWGGTFSADNHMFVVIERIHSSASLNTNPIESFVISANRSCLFASWVRPRGGVLPLLAKCSIRKAKSRWASTERFVGTVDTFSDIKNIWIWILKTVITKQS